MIYKAVGGSVHAHNTLPMYLAFGSFFSALDWTLWWLHKYTAVDQDRTNLIVVYWLKPLGYTGYVSAKGFCLYRVLTWKCLSLGQKSSHLKPTVKFVIIAAISINFLVSIIAAIVATVEILSRSTDAADVNLLLLFRATGT